MGDLPGFEIGRTVRITEIELGPTKGEIKPGGIVVDGTRSIDGGYNPPEWIRPGWPMGHITSSGYYSPCKRTRVGGTSGSVTSFVVDVSDAFKVGDVITVGTDTGKTISAINYATHTITVGGSAFTVADEDEVYAEDGSATCRGFLYEGLSARYDLGCGNLLTGGTLQGDRLHGDLDAILADPASLAAMGGRIRIFRSSTQSYVL